MVKVLGCIQSLFTLDTYDMVLLKNLWLLLHYQKSASYWLWSLDVCSSCYR